MGRKRERGSLTDVFLSVQPLVCLATLVIVQFQTYQRVVQGGASLEGIGLLQIVLMVAGAIALCALAAMVGAQGIAQMELGCLWSVITLLAGIAFAMWLDGQLGGLGVEAGPRITHFWTTWALLMALNAAMLVGGRILLRRRRPETPA